MTGQAIKGRDHMSSQNVTAAKFDAVLKALKESNRVLHSEAPATPAVMAQILRNNSVLDEMRMLGVQQADSGDEK